MRSVKVAVSWSGGKESCFACQKAIFDGFEVSYLLNLISKEGKCRSHGVDSRLMVAQSQAIEIPIIQKMVEWNTYEKDFITALQEMKQQGIEGMVFGDVHEIPGQGHAGWVDRVCSEVSIKPIKPLWSMSPEQIINDFIDEGFEAFVVRVHANILGDEWLGLRVDRNFVSNLKRLGKKLSVNICGEFGEYHTIVTDGPLFKRRLRLSSGNKRLENGRWTLEISGFELEDKKSFREQ